MRNVRRPVSANIERLEDHNLLSGNVVIKFGTIVSVSGDNNNNGVEISADETAGFLVFRGLDGTTLNGKTDPLVTQVPGGLKNLKIDLMGGDDRLVITNLSEALASWPVVSNPQSGSALFIGGNLSINGGRGKDVVLLRHLDIKGKLDVDAGGEDDIVVAESLSIGGNLNLSTGNGGDQVLLRAITVAGKTTFKGGAGNDSVGAHSSVFKQNIQFDLGKGNDLAWIEGNSFERNLEVKGAAGDDELTEDFADHNILGGKFKTSNVEGSLELTAAVHFEYEGEAGPDHWGSLTPAFLLSEAGRQQSPVDFITDDMVETDLPDIALTYLDHTNLPFVHNGHAIQVNVPAGSSIAVDGIKYDLLQFHFHTLSEHTVDGEASSLELHLVHSDAHGNLLVLGVFIEEGQVDNASFAQLIDNLPDLDVNPSETIPGPFNAELLLPADRDYFAYNGSLTTPPASEGVSFAIFKEAVLLSAAQIDALKHSIGEPNSRPVLPINDRTVFVDIV